MHAIRVAATHPKLSRAIRVAATHPSNIRNGMRVAATHPSGRENQKLMLSKLLLENTTRAGKVNKTKEAHS